METYSHSFFTWALAKHGVKAGRAAGIAGAVGAAFPDLPSFAGTAYYIGPAYLRDGWSSMDTEEVLRAIYFTGPFGGTGSALHSVVPVVALLVGGIGVMNIMLVSVAERTREIGVRKALGATNADVLFQFLLEAVLLSLIGGVVGVALGIAGSVILPEVLKDLPPAVVTANEVALAFGVSALIGVLFGVLPAYRSARLQPVEALRRE